MNEIDSKNCAAISLDHPLLNQDDLAQVMEPFVVPNPNPVMSARDKEETPRDTRRLRWADLFLGFERVGYLKKAFEIPILVRHA